VTRDNNPHHHWLLFLLSPCFQSSFVYICLLFSKFTFKVCPPNYNRFFEIWLTPLFASKSNASISHFISNWRALQVLRFFSTNRNLQTTSSLKIIFTLFVSDSNKLYSFSLRISDEFFLNKVRNSSKNTKVAFSFGLGDRSHTFESRSDKTANLHSLSRSGCE
jgi:hypothetical protein